MAGKTVKLFGMWLSPYALRVRWALHLKGIEYEYVEEDLANKSPLLLQYNPVHKKVPVLVHGEKSIAESLVIIEYIDETWKNNPLLPEDPYDRAMTRFWAKYAEEKCLPALFSVFSTVGEDQEKAIKEVQESMKVFERGLHGKRFLGGESIGFVDIIAGWFAYWVPLSEEVLGKTLVDERDFPELKRWFQDFLDTDSVKAILPPRDKLLAHLQGYREKFTSSSEHRVVEKYKCEGCPLYDKLAIVVGNTIAVGSGGATFVDQGDELFRESEHVPMDALVDFDIVRDTPSPLLSMDESPGNQFERSKQSSSSRRKKRIEMPDDDTSRFIDAMDRIAQTFKNFMMKPKVRAQN
ncbi:glutathione transferase GST 23-like [Aristolochia californica]|uniref:glutathione transferase GST 23-like n=1 Tax=Aristolochia californica TaxID=171875 RepID=UPI0035E15F15